MARSDSVAGCDWALVRKEEVLLAAAYEWDTTRLFVFVDRIACIGLDEDQESPHNVGELLHYILTGE